MGRFERHLFVCTHSREEGKECCAASGSKELFQAIKVAAFNKGLKGKVRVNQAGCLDACSEGPSMVVYPDEVWYRRVSASDVNEIVESHLENGKPVERLRYYPAAKIEKK